MRAILIVPVIAGLLGAQPVDRTKPPQTPPLPAYHLPAVQESKLPNGLAVVLLEDARFPLITVRLGRVTRLFGHDPSVWPY